LHCEQRHGERCEEQESTDVAQVVEASGMRRQNRPMPRRRGRYATTSISPFMFSP
jgi:hypothetical protein